MKVRRNYMIEEKLIRAMQKHIDKIKIKSETQFVELAISEKLNKKCIDEDKLIEFVNQCNQYPNEPVVNLFNEIFNN